MKNIDEEIKIYDYDEVIYESLFIWSNGDIFKAIYEEFKSEYFY